jgi:tetratricopeptide (TPR) repeat protein
MTHIRDQPITCVNYGTCRRQILDIESRYAGGWLSLAFLPRGLGRQEEEVEAWRKYAQLNSSQAAAHGALGEALYRAGRREEALVAFEEARRCDPVYFERNSYEAHLYAAARVRPQADSFPDGR